MTIFEQLEQWLSENRARFSKRGISVVFVQCQPTDNTAANIDIDTDAMIARATLWESMHMDFEAIVAGSAEQLIAETHQVKDMQEAFRLLEGFFARLS